MGYSVQINFPWSGLQEKRSTSGMGPRGKAAGMGCGGDVLGSGNPGVAGAAGGIAYFLTRLVGEK